VFWWMENKEYYCDTCKGLGYFLDKNNHFSGECVFCNNEMNDWIDYVLRGELKQVSGIEKYIRDFIRENRNMKPSEIMDWIRYEISYITSKNFLCYGGAFRFPTSLEISVILARNNKNEFITSRFFIDTRNP